MKKIKFKNFLNKNFDKITGWDRKPNTNGFEVSTKKTFFKINKSGHRGNKKYKKMDITYLEILLHFVDM